MANFDPLWTDTVASDHSDDADVLGWSCSNWETLVNQMEEHFNAGRSGAVVNCIMEDTGNNMLTVMARDRSQSCKRQLLTELRSQNLDVNRFATYRTACKFRFLQKCTNLYLVDVWNVIEAFRENGLTSMNGKQEVSESVVCNVLATIFETLNKRLPSDVQVSASESVNLVYSLLSLAYNKGGQDKFFVLSVKASLTMLCAGKLADKLKYVFSLVSDPNGHMLASRFSEYLRELMALPSVVSEGASFEYSDVLEKICFNPDAKVTVDVFIDTLITEPGPECLAWLPVLHRLVAAENVIHPVQCEGCHRESFSGFRYKCQRCYNYHLCQDCFWIGRTTGNHSNEHEVKEYTFYKSPAKQIEHSLKKTISCVPGRSEPCNATGVGGAVGSVMGGGSRGGGSNRGSRHSSGNQNAAIDENKKEVVPIANQALRDNHKQQNAEPNRNKMATSCSGLLLPELNGNGGLLLKPESNGLVKHISTALSAGKREREEFIPAPGRRLLCGEGMNITVAAALPPYRSRNPSPCRSGSPEFVAAVAYGREDDEHRLIARYAARLAADLTNASRSPCELVYGLDSNQAQRELVSKLEKKNRDIICEIQRLRLEQDAQAQTAFNRSAGAEKKQSPALLAELKQLRERRDELESRMSALQDSRNELMIQLQALIKILRISNPVSRLAASVDNKCSSLRFTSPSSRSPSSCSPSSHRRHEAKRGGTKMPSGDPLAVTGDQILEAFRRQHFVEARERADSLSSMRNHLFVAADSVTDAMSSLVRELNSEMYSECEEEEEEEENVGKQSEDKIEGGSGTNGIDDSLLWQRELQQRLEQERQFLEELNNHRYLTSIDGENDARRLTMSVADTDQNRITDDDESFLGRTDEEDELYDLDPQELHRNNWYNSNSAVVTHESCIDVDQESYVRTDDEDGDQTDWEDAAKRWINR